MATIKGGKVKSIASLKASMKKGGSGSAYLTRVPADATLTVRFLTEPDDENNGWVNYFEHYDSVRKFYPCSSECPGCMEGDRPSQRYLANALDVAEGKVVPLVMPKSMAASILKKYEKYATLLDRDYELSRSGTGLDTEYDVTPEPPSKMNLTRFDLIDLWDILKDQLAQAEGSNASPDDDDDDDAPAPKRVSKSAPKSVVEAIIGDDDDEDADEDEDDEVYANGGSGAAVLEADVDEDEDTDDSDDDGEYMTRDDYMEMSLAELKAIAKDDVGFTVAELRGKDKDAIIDMLLEATEEELSGDDDADSDDDADEEELTEDDLRAMSLAEVKNVAREIGVRVKAGTSKDDIVDLILDAAAGDDDDDDDDEEVPF